MGRPSLFVSAGDPSGDNATSRVISALRQNRPELEFFGLGGRRLKLLGQKQFADSEALAVLGFWEVARKYTFFRKLAFRCLDEIRQRKPSCALLVDYPGFNLRLAKKIKALGVPVVYYISPQVWAWAKGRLATIRRYVDLMLLILPFEEPFYRRHGVPAQFVGHYLLEDIPREYIQSSPVNRRQIAVLPGSRRQEIERMLPPMLEAVRVLSRDHDTTATVAAIQDAFDYESLIDPDKDTGISICYGDSRRVMFESDLVLTSSGTATLEAGIIGRPMVIVYRTGFITYQIARRLVKLDQIGLVNLVLGEKVVPELIQNEATPRKMATALSRYLHEDGYRTRVRAKLSRLPDLLGCEGASERTAEIVNQYL